MGMASNFRKAMILSAPGWRKVSSSAFTHSRFLQQSLHQLLNLALAAIHDSFKVSRFENDTPSDQDNVVAAGQERDTVCNEDPSFGRE